MKTQTLDWGECDNCGGQAEVVTSDETEANKVMDGDECTCRQCGCIGYAVVPGSKDAYIDWEEAEEDEE